MYIRSGNARKMRCGSPGFPFLACCLCLAVLTLLLPEASSLPALPLISNSSSALNVYSVPILFENCYSATLTESRIHSSELFPIPDSKIALRFWAFGSEVEAVCSPFCFISLLGPVHVLSLEWHVKDLRQSARANGRRAPCIPPEMSGGD